LLHFCDRSESFKIGWEIANTVCPAALATGNLECARTSHKHQISVEPSQLTSSVLLNVVEACFHVSTCRRLSASRALKRLHEEIFKEWVSYALERKKADIELYIAGIDQVVSADNVWVPVTAATAANKQ
jgi:hypothetical protein